MLSLLGPTAILYFVRGLMEPSSCSALLPVGEKRKLWWGDFWMQLMPQRTSLVGHEKMLRPKPHCPTCKGEGQIIRVAKEYRGGKLVRTFEYKQDCSWCTAASLFAQKGDFIGS